MEIGSLVEQCDGSSVRRVGTVRALNEKEAVVEWQGGESEQLPVPVGETVRVLVPGTFRHKAATDLVTMQHEFESNPVEVLVEILRELRKPVSIATLRDYVESTGIVAHMFVDEWGGVRALLLAHPQVRSASKGGVRWVGDGSGPSQPARQWSSSEALQELVNSTHKKKEAKQSLLAAVSAGLDTLSPYELLVAHARGVPVTEWPPQWTEPQPERVPEDIRLIAVQHIVEMSRARRRIVLPGTDASQASIKAAEIPSSLELLPLVVPLVAMPAKSLAADKAAKALSGEDAWNALRAAMTCFEQALPVCSGSEDAPDQKEELASLLIRAKDLLQTALKKRPREGDLPWLDFAEEMAVRARALLADQRIHEQRNALVREWAEYVAGHSDIPVELREAARAAQDAAATEGTDPVTADGTGGSDGEKGDRQTEVTPEPLPGAEEPEGTDAVGEGDTRAEDGDADSTGFVSDEPVLEVTEDAPDETPEDAQAQVEILNRLLREEQVKAAAAQAHLERQRRDASDALAEAEATAKRLRLRIADEEKLREEAEARARAAEASAEAARQSLEGAEQRVEAMTRQLRRRDDELRQSRQTARGASQAQLRQARIDTLRVLAAVLTEVADQAIHEDDEMGPANALYRRALARAAEAGVLDMAALGEETDYDPVRHRAPGGPAPRVVVERPGFVWQGPLEPEPIVLEQALVRGVEQ
ncbi:hypothetical protein GCM10018789_11130 [Streptomyces werraensis]|nr:hypothetical protein GCM10018789_11130 [Streptomyces werraensis]